MSKVHFSIPLDINNNLFYNISRQQLNNKTVYKKNQLFPFNIDSFYGCLPYSLWNGGINSNVGNLFLYEDIEEFQYNFFSPFRIDCSNIYLNNKDFLNTYMNLILSKFADMGNQIEISNLDLYKYINEKYNLNNFIFSKNADLIYPFDLDIINQFCEKEEIKLISLPFRLNEDFELLTKINDKSKIEINIFNKCNNCESRKNCDIMEQQNQYNFLSSSIFNINCSNYNYNINNNFEILKVIEPFIDIGITHFKIDSPINELKNNFYQWLLYNLFDKNYIEVVKNGN